MSTSTEYVGHCEHGPWPIDANSRDEAIATAKTSAAEEGCELAAVTETKTITIGTTIWARRSPQ